MTNEQRLIKAEQILEDQTRGVLTKGQAAAEFDQILDETGDLHYYSDTTKLKETWQRVMVMVLPTNSLSASNIGLITQGSKRGTFVHRPNTTINNASQACLDHFWI